MLKDAPIHPSLATKDLAQARSWYADKVGWEPSLEPPGTLVYQVGSRSSLCTSPSTPAPRGTRS